MKNLKFQFVLIALLFTCISSYAQINARLFRYPDVSENKITFTYAGDIWIVDKNGGLANKISSPSGEETWPKFSPDGSKIAFTANYDGSEDVYLIPVSGGIPARLTYHNAYDRVLGWHPDGTRVLFSSSRESGRQRFSQFYTISEKGGIATKLPVPYGEFGSFSANGEKFVYTDKSRVFRTWKRYRGGMAPDMVLFNLQDKSHENISPNIANDELPMFSGNKIYFLSDRGAVKRYNIWVYNLETKETKQLTKFDKFDVHFPSIGPKDIVFEADGKIHLLSLENESVRTIEVQVITDQFLSKQKLTKVKKLMENAHISYDGKRVVVEARGDLFSVPAEHGYVKNLTNTSGAAERYPAWSPDGTKIAFWSDKSGEYQLYVMNMKDGTQKKLTNYADGFRYQLYWSPNSEMLAFIDQTMSIKIFTTKTNQTIDVDKGLWMFQGGLASFSVNWSPDSKWLTYSRGENNRNHSIFLFDTKNLKKTKITSQFYNDFAPVFDPEGKQLYFLTNRFMQPQYSDFDNSFVYRNSCQIAAISLKKDIPSVLTPKNDEVELKKDEKSEKSKKDKKEKDEADKITPVEIDFDNIEQRIALLPVKAGTYGNLSAVNKKVIYHDFTNANGSKPSVKYYDFEKEEEKTIIEDVSDYLLSHDKKKILVYNSEELAIIDVQENQKMEKTLRLDEMEATVEPKEEWKQIFTEAWRLQRDFFYDKNMHGVDWPAMKAYYGGLLKDAVTRWDVNFVIGEMIAELNASHSYRGGGDNPDEPSTNVGYLGVDWELSNGFYKIKRIVNGAPWDAEARSPLALSGVNVKPGDYILAVNGVRLSAQNEPFNAFQGLAGKVVELTVNSKPDFNGARKEIVKTLASETRLRHLEWIEKNRKRVEQATNGKVGYIYVRSTGIDGQNELIRQFMGQWNLDALIIDERFNSGGQIPDRFIELLNRREIVHWAVRDGKNWQWPPIANFGPKVMLINGWSGSGGDAFPYYFKNAGLGPLIGTRTWGGLIGISGAPSLIDGGAVTVPTFRMYDPDGTWFKEGHGVDPDIEVPEDPTKLANGVDPQLEKAIEWILDELKKNPVSNPKPKAYEKR
jgi:tricorn protease